MSLDFPNLQQALETRGWGVVPQSLSDRLVWKLKQRPSIDSNLTLIRQVFEGIPRRLTEYFSGEQILSAYSHGAPAGWHNGRPDLSATRLPDSFAPGYDFAFYLGETGVSFSALSGFRQFGGEDEIVFGLANEAALDPGDFLLMDCRIWRRWPDEQRENIFWFTTVRPWISVSKDFSEHVRDKTPARALRFYGSACRPFRNVGDWIFAAHGKRPETKEESI